MLLARISRTLFVLPSPIQLVIGPLILLSPLEKNRQPGNSLKNSISGCFLHRVRLWDATLSASPEDAKWLGAGSCQQNTTQTAVVLGPS
jgi:hypothetical protein